MSTTTEIPFSTRPPLQQGDYLTAEEFERRYEAMPNLKKAELIAGIVYLQETVPFEDHACPHAHMGLWLGTYGAYTFGVRGGSNSTVRLNSKNCPQPDLLLLIDPKCGGATTLINGFVTGPPEHIDEISSHRASYDSNQKLNEYHAAGIPEYVVWRVWDRAIDWFVREDSQYRKIDAENGIYRSHIFPGLWLDAEAMISGDMKRVLAVLHQGLATPEHAAFCAKLKQKLGQ